MTATTPRPTLRDPALRTGFGCALGVFVVVRLIGLAVLGSAAANRGTTLTERLASWDGQWFLEIARFGYPGQIVLDPSDDTSGRYAFFPGFPWLIRAVHALGPSYEGAGLLITIVAGLVAAAGLYCYTARLAGIAAAVVAVGLWAAMPMSIVLSMVYSEALFVAFAIWALYALLDDRFVLAGGLGLCAGLVRIHGIAVGLAICAAATVYLVRRRGRWPAPVAGSVIGLLGVPLWWMYSAIDGGRFDGWMAVQRFYWGNYFDFGRYFLTETWRAVSFQGNATGQDAAGDVVYFATVLGLWVAIGLALNLLWRARRDTAWLAPAVYSLVILGLTVGAYGFLHSKLRYLVPIAPLVIPVAIVLARRGRAASIGGVVVAVIVSAWWGAFVLTVWKYAI